MTYRTIFSPIVGWIYFGCGILLSLPLQGDLMNADTKNKKFDYQFDALPYAYESLEPYIDAQTMHLHHEKHHKAYFDGWQKAFAACPELATKSLEYWLDHLDKVPESVRGNVRDFGGGYVNHNFFWQCMSSQHDQQPSGVLLKNIERTFGSLEKFKAEWKQRAAAHIGSGWVWLCVHPETSELQIAVTYNHEVTPVNLGTPVLVMDIWEHAYYLKYQNRKGDFVDAWWHVVDWDGVMQRYDALAGAVVEPDDKR